MRPKFSLRYEEIVLTEEHPELDVQHVVKVIRRHGLKPAPPKASAPDGESNVETCYGSG